MLKTSESRASLIGHHANQHKRCERYNTHRVGHDHERLGWRDTTGVRITVMPPAMNATSSSVVERTWSLSEASFAIIRRRTRIPPHSAATVDIRESIHATVAASAVLDSSIAGCFGANFCFRFLVMAIDTRDFRNKNTSGDIVGRRSPTRHPVSTQKLLTMFRTGCTRDSWSPLFRPMGDRRS